MGAIYSLCYLAAETQRNIQGLRSAVFSPVGEAFWRLWNLPVGQMYSCHVGLDERRGV